LARGRCGAPSAGTRNPCGAEAQLTFVALLARAARDLGASFDAVGEPDLAQK